jgi:hypothetical protein
MPPTGLSDHVEVGAVGSTDPISPEIPPRVCTDARQSDRDVHQMPESEYGRERASCTVGVAGFRVTACPAIPPTVTQKPASAHEMPYSEPSSPCWVDVLVHGTAAVGSEVVNRLPAKSTAAHRSFEGHEIPVSGGWQVSPVPVQS